MFICRQPDLSTEENNVKFRRYALLFLNYCIIVYRARRNMSNISATNYRARCPSLCFCATKITTCVRASENVGFSRKAYLTYQKRVRVCSSEELSRAQLQSTCNLGNVETHKCARAAGDSRIINRRHRAVDSRWRSSATSITAENDDDDDDVRRTTRTNERSSNPVGLENRIMPLSFPVARYSRIYDE